MPEMPPEKHYEVNFVDGTCETVMGDVRRIDNWWEVTLLHLDAETSSKFVPFGHIRINMDNVTFIKET